MWKLKTVMQTPIRGRATMSICKKARMADAISHRRRQYAFQATYEQTDKQKNVAIS